MSKPIESLIPELQSGDCVVASSSCSQLEIAYADAEGRLYVTADGLGYVRRPAPWLHLAESAITFYNRCLVAGFDPREVETASEDHIGTKFECDNCGMLPPDCRCANQV